ncbi:hypothetical protein O3M35_008263 [Rhynocoris fuscipes]|uniref:Uncharacterized protein n=1 Tax=Rhynocoris fuscipes TaxID=488301 RepID=A0AAW1DCP3_9HEMI
MFKFLHINTLGRKLLNIKLQLNTFRNDRIRVQNVFYVSSEVATCLADCAQKLIKAKLSNIRKEYKEC